MQNRHLHASLLLLLPCAKEQSTADGSASQGLGLGIICRAVELLLEPA